MGVYASNKDGEIHEVDADLIQAALTEINAHEEERDAHQALINQMQKEITKAESKLTETAAAISREAGKITGLLPEGYSVMVGQHKVEHRRGHAVTPTVRKEVLDEHEEQLPLGVGIVETVQVDRRALPEDFPEDEITNSKRVYPTVTAIRDAAPLLADVGLSVKALLSDPPRKPARVMVDGNHINP